MRIVLVIALLVLCGQVWSQDFRIDETEKSRESVDSYNEKAASHANNDSVFFYYFRAVTIARSILYYEGELAACRGLKEFHKDEKIIDNRLEYTYRIVQIQEKKGTNSDKADAYQDLGKLYFDQKIFDKAIENFKKGFEMQGIGLNKKFDAGIWLTRSYRNAGEDDDALVSARNLQFEETKMSPLQRITLYKEKAEIYHTLSLYENELEAYERITEIAKNTRYDYFVPTAWNNIGFVQKFLNNKNEAKSAFLKTIETAGTNSTELKATANYNLGLILHNQGKSDSAMTRFKEAYKLYKQRNDYDALATSRNMMALSYYHNNDMFNAQQELNAAFDLEKKYTLKKQEAKSHEIQSLFYEDLYDYENSLASYKRFLSIRDSLLIIERTAESQLLYNQFKAEQLEKQLRVVWAANELEIISVAEERARLQAEQERQAAEIERAAAQMERDRRLLKERDLEIATKKAELRRLQLEEERLNSEAKQQQLDLAQRDQKLAELALEKEQLEVKRRDDELRILAQEKRLEAQEFQNTLQLILGVLLFFVIIFLVILIAYRQLRKRKKRIEEQNVIIAESAKEIELQKEKSDGLLLNILPLAVAEELKSNGASKPRLYEDVSVGFTDFSGFTMISEKLTPEKLVARLDAMFLEFDKIIEKYHLQRIKTIGDAYMFAAGLPDPLEDHAERSIKASLEIRDFIKAFNQQLKPGEPKWNIRIGVHSGPVVAGVIGIKKFAYDIWGDTVNTAARMESSGEVGKVNISGITKSHLNGGFQTQHRGKVEAKNKGAIEMYFVEKKK